MVKLITWNIARREEAWRLLLRSKADIALLQEVAAPPPDLAGKLDINPAPWHTAGAGRSRPWRSAIVKLSDRVELEWIEARSIEDAHANDFAVSRIGTLAVAEVKQSSCEPFLVASM